MFTRGITKEMIERALNNPDQTGVGYKGKPLAYKNFGEERIKVVYTKEGERNVIISVMWSSDANYL